MTKTLTFILSLLAASVLYAQNNKKVPIDGHYYLLNAENANNQQGTTKELDFQMYENNGVNILAVVACKKCFPATYYYQKEISNKLKRAVYYSKAGLYLIKYDEESFAVCMPSPSVLMGNEKWKKFLHLNMYSKNKKIFSSMSESKLKKFLIQMSEKAL